MKAGARLDVLEQRVCLQHGVGRGLGALAHRHKHALVVLEARVCTRRGTHSLQEMWDQ